MGSSISRLMFFALLLVYIGYLTLTEYYDWSHSLTEEGILFLAWGLFVFLLTMVIQTFLHELGHLVAGLLSGYHFSSFRVGPFKWQKWNGRIQFHLVALPGTLGQCLMIPPGASTPVRSASSQPESPSGVSNPGPSSMVQSADQKRSSSIPSYPFLLYNLGGVLANGLSAGAALIWFMTLNPYSLEGCFAFGLMITGLMLAFANGIPAENGVTFNDGTNVQELLQYPGAVKGYWIQLMGAVYGDQHLGPDQYPDSWFDAQLIEDVSSPVSTSALLLYVEHLQATHQLDRLEAYLEQLPYRSEHSRMPAEDQDLLDLERLFLLALHGDAEAVQDWMLEIRLDEIQDRLKDHPALYRTIWSIDALNQQPQQARAALVEFETLLQRYKQTHPWKMKLEMDLFQEAARQLDPTHTFQHAMFHPTPPAL